MTTAISTMMGEAIGKAIAIAVTHQKCPRRRLLQFNILGNGIEPVYLDPVKTAGAWIARGIVAILTGTDTQTAIRTVLNSFDEEYVSRGIDPDHGDPFTVYNEQRTLVEAVLLGYQMAVVEGMRLQFEPLGDMLRERATGKMLSHVVRVVADADNDTVARDLHSLHTVARGAYDHELWGDLYDGSWFQYVAIGERRKRAGETIRTQRTPFITGYRQKVGGRLAPSLIRKDKRTGNVTRLGNDFKLFRVWENRSPVKLEQWVSMLHGWGQFHELFKQARVNPPEPREAYEALRDVTTFNSLPTPEPATFPEQALEWFPMFRHSCDVPYVCPYQQMECCYGDIPITDPTRGGVYRQKEKHGNQ